MSDEQQNIDDRPARDVPGGDAPTAVASAAPAEPRYEPEGDWLDDAEELPPRPRRRLLTPIPLTLIAILAIACGFIAGVLVEKGQGGSTSGSGAAGAFASRLAAASGSSAGASSSASASGSATAASGVAGRSRFGGGAGAGAAGGGASGSGATIGQVAYVSKGTLYVTTLEGNTVKVTAAPGASVTKSVKTKPDGIHPGETVVVTGAAGADGAIAAQSIRAGSASAGLTGAAGLFGGSTSSSSGASGSGGGASSSAGTSGSGAGATGSGSSGGEQPLFGKG